MKRCLPCLFFLWLSFCIMLSPADGRSEMLTLHFIDAGEGEAILVQTPRDRTALIDCGNFITGFRVRAYLRKRGISRLDHLIITHMHTDHYGGVFHLQDLEILHTHDNGEKLDLSQPRFRWYNSLIREREDYASLKKGDTLSLGSVTLAVLWPEKPFTHAGRNARSLVTRLTYGAFRALFPADVPSSVDKKLLKSKDTAPAQVLKVPHHGHDDATSEAFLSAVDPQAAVIMIDEGNINGYPADSVLSRLSEHGIKIFQTSEHGTIVIKARRDGTWQAQE